MRLLSPVPSDSGAQNVNQQKKRSKKKSSAQAGKSAIFYGRSHRLTNCRAVASQANNGDLYGRCDRSPFPESNSCQFESIARFSYLTLGSRRLTRRRRRPRRSRSWSCKLRFPFFPKIDAARAFTLSPFEILINTSFHADVRARVCGTAPVIPSRHSHIDFRLCLTFYDRTFATRFFRFHDRSSFVSQNLCSIPRHCGQSKTRAPGEPAKRVRLGITPCAEVWRQRLQGVRWFVRTVERRNVHGELSNGDC